MRVGFGGKVRLAIAGALVPGLVGVPAPAASVTACSKGNVALTFDDGPRLPYTGSILDTLKAKRAQATFFVVGRVAAGQPSMLRRMHAEGHRIGNHSWSHPALSSLSSAGIANELDRTNSLIRSHGLPAPKVMRPPYGATNLTVRSVAASRGLAHVMWDVDTSDWRTGRSASSIVAAAVGGLHAGANILMHDGVGNSGATVAALPRIIEGARARGYCIGNLDDAGRVVPATPVIRIRNAKIREADPGTRTKLSFTIALSVPTSRKVKVSWATRDRTAVAGRDYRERSGTVAFAPGTTAATVTVPVVGDNLDEFNERLTVRLSAPAAGTIGRGSATGVIVDDDAPAVIRVGDARTHESTSPAKVPVRLNRPSGKRITVGYTTPGLSATPGVHYVATRGSLVFRPGQTEKVVAVPVIDRKAYDEGTMTFGLAVGSPVNATIGRRSGVVSVRDDPMPDLSAAHGSINEGATSGTADVVVMLSHTTQRTVTVAFTTADRTARAGVDYVRVHGTLKFPPGVKSRRVSIPIVNNATYSGDRHLALQLSRLDGAPLNARFDTRAATVTIIDDERAPDIDGEDGP
jgi:peptidoglycan/xylan/chitin deacetylase (PgdA/CDA1 family)